jgi:hypothetical protein
MSALTGEHAGLSIESAAGFSPFSGLSLHSADHAEARSADIGTLESPFSAGLVSESPDRADEAAAELLEALQDEDFEDALELLVDEAAAHHLAARGAWSAEPSATETWGALEEWMEPLAAESERAIDELARSLAHVDLLGMPSGDLDELLNTAADVPPLGSEGFDQFLGGLIRKAGKLVGGAVNIAKKGIAVAGKFTPIGILLNKLKGLVRPLLRGVLQSAMNRLPESVRPIAKTLAARFGLGAAEAPADAIATLSEGFDVEATALLFAPDEQNDLFEAKGDDSEASVDRFADLDAARARLTQQLMELPAGAHPIAEIEQFVPPTLAARPLIKLGLSLVGRDKVVRFIADRIARLIKGKIGEEAARTISRPIVDVGLRMLGFEVPVEQERAIAAEALASTIEGTVLRLLELPADAFADEVQLDAALQQAFAESAAAYLPDRLLRPDLPERETAGEGGVWVLMPRATRPCYRFRRYSRTFAVPLSRQLCRRVPWSDGGTLETYLLDHGVDEWPVQAEVDLYEALPGTQLGHLTQDETSAGARRSDSAEFQPLTPDIAGLLLREPALGRGSPTRAGWGRRPRPVPGARYFRVRAHGLGKRGRRIRRLLVRVNSAAAQLRITLRVSERQAQQLLARMERSAPSGQRDLPSVLLALRGLYEATLPALLAARLLKRKIVADPATARSVADRISASVTTGLSAFLTKSAAQFVAAVQDPADGVTITFTLNGFSMDKPDVDLSPAEVAVRPGHDNG